MTEHPSDSGQQLVDVRRDAAKLGTTLHFIDTTGPGGAETIFLELASGLRDRGWRTRTVVVGSGWVLDGVRARELPVDIVPTRGRLDFSYLRQLHGLVRRHGVKLIHAHMYSPAVYASIVGGLTGASVVATFHGRTDVDREGIGRRLRYRLINRQATVVCVSTSLATELDPDGRGRFRDLRVIHNGVDTSARGETRRSLLRREHGVSDDTFLVGAIGNVRPAKDYPNLLRAASRLRADESVKFCIVGQPTDPLYSELLRIRDDLGLSERVSFWGFRNDIPDVLSAMDALVISSSSEGFSLAAVQAMSAGRPVIATRCGGPEEILTHGVDGILVPTSDPDSLAAAIRTIAADRALREGLARAARETAVTRFSLTAMLDQYEQIYRRVLASQASGREAGDQRIPRDG